MPILDYGKLTIMIRLCYRREIEQQMKEGVAKLNWK
jgi:hypothetical protein